jgi:hypothetical protein
VICALILGRRVAGRRIYDGEDGVGRHRSADRVLLAPGLAKDRANRLDSR